MKYNSIIKNYNIKKEVLKNSKEILSFLSVELGERTLQKYSNLQNTRKFIYDYFARYGHEPFEETYTVEAKEVSNIITEIKGFSSPDDIIIIGAHYDTVQDTPGADDNGTAIAGLLELYRLLSEFKFKKTIRFVAFTLEEPPYFNTEQMGSMHNAKLCKDRNENIELMICLEMLGYAGRRINQDFPNEYLRKRAPKYGNFLSVISLPSSEKAARLWKKIYNKHSKKAIFDLIAPASIPGVGLSDHMSFTNFGYKSIMICDTGFYRNKNYHTKNDTYDTINFKFLTNNIINCFFTIREILNMDGLEKNMN